MHSVNSAAASQQSAGSPANIQSTISQPPIPHFIPASAVIRPRICRQLMRKPRDCVFSYRFNIRIYFQRARCERRRKSRTELLRTSDSLLQGMCFCYNPLTNEAEHSVSQLASECGLTSTSASGTVSISSASRAIQAFERESGFIVQNLPASGGYFTPAFFEALKVSPDHLRATRVKSERLQRRRGAVS